MQLGGNGCDSSVVDRPGNPRDLNSDILTLEVPSRDQVLPAPGGSGDTSENVTAASSTPDLHSDVLTPEAVTKHCQHQGSQVTPVIRSLLTALPQHFHSTSTAQISPAVTKHCQHQWSPVIRNTSSYILYRVG